MPSGSHPASPSKRRSRSPTRFEPEPEPEVVEEAPVELEAAVAPAPVGATYLRNARSEMDDTARLKRGSFPSKKSSRGTLRIE